MPAGKAENRVGEQVVDDAGGPRASKAADHSPQPQQAPEAAFSQFSKANRACYPPVHTTFPTPISVMES
jgi:hypothetical protein